eukprot:1141722-Pelagomonas_calceolata.AAC.3
MYSAQAAKHRPLKSFLIELAINWVSHKHKMEVRKMMHMECTWNTGRDWQMKEMEVGKQHKFDCCMALGSGHIVWMSGVLSCFEPGDFCWAYCTLAQEHAQLAGGCRVLVNKSISPRCRASERCVWKTHALQPMNFLSFCCFGIAKKLPSTSIKLDMKFKLPKMRYKGEVVETQRIRVDKKPLVSEVKDVPEEPTFALRYVGEAKLTKSLAKAACLRGERLQSRGVPMRISGRAFCS